MEHYKDLDLDFTNGVYKLTDNNSIKNSIVNLLLFDFHDIYLNDNFGGFLKDILFENITQVDMSLLNERIEWIISTYENRVTVNDIDISSSSSQVDIKITYTIKKTDQKHTLTYIRDIAHENRL